MKKITTLTLMLVFIAFGLSSNQKSTKTKTITFITTAICEDCKERIENKLNYTKGIVYAELNLDNKMLTVKFKPDVISEQKIKETLASIGYSSDTVKRDAEAYNALPKCCQGSTVCEPKK